MHFLYPVYILLILFIFLFTPVFGIGKYCFIRISRRPIEYAHARICSDICCCAAKIRRLKRFYQFFHKKRIKTACYFSQRFDSICFSILTFRYFKLFHALFCYLRSNRVYTCNWYSFILHFSSCNSDMLAPRSSFQLAGSWFLVLGS